MTEHFLRREGEMCDTVAARYLITFAARRNAGQFKRWPVAA